jgi:hypothetical protein
MGGKSCDTPIGSIALAARPKYWIIVLCQWKPDVTGPSGMSAVMLCGRGAMLLVCCLAHATVHGVEVIHVRNITAHSVLRLVGGLPAVFLRTHLYNLFTHRTGHRTFTGREFCVTWVRALWQALAAEDAKHSGAGNALDFLSVM